MRSSARACHDLWAAPTVLIVMANGPEAQRQRVKGRVRLQMAGAPPAAATIERIEGELGWRVMHIYGLRNAVDRSLQSGARPDSRDLKSLLEQLYARER